MSVANESFNVEYQVDQAFQFFKSRKLDKLIGKIQNDLLSRERWILPKTK